MTKPKDAARKAAERYMVEQWGTDVHPYSVTKLARLLRAYGNREYERGRTVGFEQGLATTIRVSKYPGGKP